MEDFLLVIRMLNLKEIQKCFSITSAKLHYDCRSMFMYYFFKMMIFLSQNPECIKIITSSDRYCIVYKSVILVDCFINHIHIWPLLTSLPILSSSSIASEAKDQLGLLKLRFLKEALDEDYIHSTYNLILKNQNQVCHLHF